MQSKIELREFLLYSVNGIKKSLIELMFRKCFAENLKFGEEIRWNFVKMRKYCKNM